ncbi:MAG: transketolase [Candidatus Omnitrophica bacterium]|nr:transketolase [Candidatus Omnitrophota bacterium]
MLNAFKDAIYEAAKNDKRIILMVTDNDIGLSHMQAEMPDQYFVEGISEANTMGVASGLAADGFMPFIINIASFLVRRSYEQIVLDVCLQNRPVRLIGIGGGFSMAHLGTTHTTIEDIAIMRAVPEMTVIAPCDALEMKKLVPSILKWPKPIYIRLARYGKPVVTKEESDIDIGKAVVLRQASAGHKSVLLISTGAMTSRTIKTAEELQNLGIESTVLHLHTIKPLDEKAIIEQARRVPLVVTIEDHSIIGGLGSACMGVLMNNMHPDLPRLHCIGVPDKFIHVYGTQESLLKSVGLEPSQMAKTIYQLTK